MKQSSDKRMVAKLLNRDSVTKLGSLTDIAFGENGEKEEELEKNKAQVQDSNSEIVNDGITSLNPNLKDKKQILKIFKNIILDIVKDKSKKYQRLLYHRELFQEFVKISSFEFFYEESVLERIPKTETDLDCLLQETGTLDSVEKFLLNNRLRRDYKSLGEKVKIQKKVTESV